MRNLLNSGKLSKPAEEVATIAEKRASKVRKMILDELDTAIENAQNATVDENVKSSAAYSLTNKDDYAIFLYQNNDEQKRYERLRDTSIKIENANNEESVRLSVIRTNSNNSINTLDSINNQIVASEENSSLNDNNNNNNENQIKTEFHIKDTLLKKIINNNDTVDKKNINENNKKIIEQPKKDENDDFITTKINEEKDKNEKSNKIPLKEEIIKN